MHFFEFRGLADGFIHDIINIVNKIGGVIVSQTGNIAPADKKIYALRDVTDTVQSIPLIASSVMSKKIACNNDIIVLDIKVGDGAFMKTISEARALAKLCISIGESYGKKVSAIISNMDTPLGQTVGCALETKEAIAVLQGAQGHLTDMVFALFAKTIQLAGIECDAKAEFDHLISSGKALNKLKEIISSLGGSLDFFDKELTPVGMFYANKDGFIHNILSEKLANIVNDLGGGRKKVDDVIDLYVGIKLCVDIGDYVKKGDCLALLYNIPNITQVCNKLEDVVILSEDRPKISPLILDIL